MTFRAAALAGLFLCAASCGSPPPHPGPSVSPTPLSSDGITETVRSHLAQKAVLVNVWATWCPPCVEEFPLIVQLQKKYQKDLQVIFISVDFPEDKSRVARFLESQGVDWPAFIKTGDDASFIASVDPNWTGAVPATAVYNKRGERIIFWEGPATLEHFEKHIRMAVDPVTGNP